MLVRAAMWASGEPPVHVEAPNTVEATYWRDDDGSTLVHLLNHTHDAMFPAPPSGEKMPASREVFRAIREVVPVDGVTIQLASTPTAVDVLIGDVEARMDGQLIRLGRLAEYAVVRVQPQAATPG